jgi:hypothetical protein
VPLAAERLVEQEGSVSRAPALAAVLLVAVLWPFGQQAQNVPGVPAASQPGTEWGFHSSVKLACAPMPRRQVSCA